MTPEQINKAMAIIDGYKLEDGCFVQRFPVGTICKYPSELNYTTDLNEAFRVLKEYILKNGILEINKYLSEDCVDDILELCLDDSPALHLCTALLKAADMWEDS